MSRKLRDKDYLEHIQEAIGKIFRYVPNKDEAEFMAKVMNILRELDRPAR